MDSRDKGRSYEYEVSSELFDHLGIRFRRDLDQYRQSGRGDLVTEEHFPFLIECKRYKQGPFRPSWMRQAEAAAKPDGKVPVVVFRFNYGLSQVAMRAGDLCIVFGGWPRDEWADMDGIIFMDLPTFCTFAREVLS